MNCSSAMHSIAMEDMPHCTLPRFLRWFHHSSCVILDRPKYSIPFCSSMAYHIKHGKLQYAHSLTVLVICEYASLVKQARKSSLELWQIKWEFYSRAQHITFQSGYLTLAKSQSRDPGVISAIWSRPATTVYGLWFWPSCWPIILSVMDSADIFSYRAQQA